MTLHKANEQFVFCHGIWADGSCFSQGELPRASGRNGHEVE